MLLVETDSPFLAPQSVRGKPNQPANVVEVAERLAAEPGHPLRGDGARWSRQTRAPSFAGEPATADGRGPVGQNFLADPNLLEAIVRDAALEPGDVALEVGRGKGC